MPEGQISGRGPDDPTPLVGATVNLVRISDNVVVETTTSNAQGQYGFDNLVASSDYAVRASKTLADSSLIRVCAIVSSDSSVTPEVVDVDYISTVSWRALTDQIALAQTNLTTSQFSDLQTMAQDWESDYLGLTLPAPDLTSTTSIGTAAGQLLAALTPDGTYVGSISGFGKVALLAKSGQYTIVVFASDEAAMVTGSGNLRDDNPVIYGTFDNPSLIDGQSNDGLIDFTGFGDADNFRGYVKKGSSFASVSLSRVTAAGRGLYFGAFDADSVFSGGYFAVLSEANGTVSVSAYDSLAAIRIVGTGTSNGSTMSFSWLDSFGDRGTNSTGTRSGGSFTGTYVTALDDNMPWTATDTFVPF